MATKRLCLSAPIEYWPPAGAARGQFSAGDNTLVQKAANAEEADEAKKNGPELDIPAEIARRQERLEAIAAAKARLECYRQPISLHVVSVRRGSSALNLEATSGLTQGVTQPGTELVIALGREGKVLAKPRDEKRYPHTVAMVAKLETEQCKAE